MDNENTALYRETFFDKIFKPQVITLENGHTVRRPRSRTPLIVLALALAIVWALKMTGFDLAVIVSRFSKMLDLLKKIFHPNWEFFPKVVSPLLDTIKMSILGTVIGCAIAIFTFGVVSKMLYESIETIDMGPFEAMEALGANKFQAFWSACVPQILPVYLSHCLYCFEMNIRASAILGYVGAGGLGITINERIGWRDYESLGMVLLTLFVVVAFIEFFSAYLRKKLS